MIKFSFTFFLFALGVIAQENKIDPNIRKQIEEYNSSFAAAFTNGSHNALLKAYTEQTIFMPEHSRQRLGKKSIADFYKQWLDQAKITSYQRTILELQDFGNYFLEIGTFIENLEKRNIEPYTYSGKYMVLWKKVSNNKPMTIAAEIWGSSSYLEDKFIPEVNDALVPPTKEFVTSNKLDLEVIERNNSIKRLVQNRLGGEHAKMFLPDAMYLTYYTPILSGEKDITAYFTEHEKPGTLSIDKISIQTSGIINTQKAIVEFGYYSVNWSDGDKGGNVKGKSINVWKRNSNGELMLFRQMVNHD